MAGTSVPESLPGFCRHADCDVMHAERATRHQSKCTLPAESTAPYTLHQIKPSENVEAVGLHSAGSGTASPTRSGATRGGRSTCSPQEHICHICKYSSTMMSNSSSFFQREQSGRLPRPVRAARWHGCREKSDLGRTATSRLPELKTFRELSDTKLLWWIVYAYAMRAKVQLLGLRCLHRGVFAPAPSMAFPCRSMHADEWFSNSNEARNRQTVHSAQASLNQFASDQVFKGFVIPSSS